MEDNDKLNRLLDVVSMLESSGGRDIAHKKIKRGIQAGDRAVGEYGLMPNTVDELIQREKHTPEGATYPELKGMESKDLQNIFSSDVNTPEMLRRTPEGVERYLAEKLGERVLERQGGDVAKAATAWHQGHNLTEDELNNLLKNKHSFAKERLRRATNVANRLDRNDNFAKLKELLKNP